MRGRSVIGGMIPFSSLLLVLGCSIANPYYDPGLDEEELPEDADGLHESELLAGSSDDGDGPSDDEPDDPEPPSEPGGDGPGDDGAAVDDEPASPLLYSSLDSLDAVIEPEVGSGFGLVSDPAPEVTPAVDAQGLRTTTGLQWFAFPQHDGQVPNIDHRAGSLSLDVRAEFEAPHWSPRNLVSLAGVVPDGGGIRVGVTGWLEGNRFVVEYIDAQAQVHRTLYPADLLPIDQWVRVEVAWRADVEPDEANVELWIGGVFVDPVEGFSSGPKQVGDASPEDVLIFGSWSLGTGYSAEASFDEVEIWRE